jgi:hypothetical protein
MLNCMEVIWIWCFATIYVTMVLPDAYGSLCIWYSDTIWEAVYMVVCHHRGQYGILKPYETLCIWYFATVEARYGTLKPYGRLYIW